MVESFFKSLNAEMIWRRNWQTRREVEVAIFPFHGLHPNRCRATEYINGFYNLRRRHSALGWKSPVAFERKAA
jgi:transposase InsO family protein